ncbi:hypothetical protein LMG22037_05135 [Paraburkholderia phenoliruptrix]|uniref:Type II toxin-antitoxin system RelE/ParE family toxin n=1 Tax=Paraburkholderia phenoliruptrix TaxID=252970 RepID=A0A6J5C2X4_9BURK|nr:hypothetical protein [Paraburkholderia phenoliruptrix]CAB3725598.1 hypothetical protein LMG22037_05135 [Paraburkholderia phenoliruptrix]
MESALTLHASRKLKELPTNDVARILAAISDLVRHGQPLAAARARKIDNNLYELRVGKYAAIYQLEDNRIPVGLFPSKASTIMSMP